MHLIQTPSQRPGTGPLGDLSQMRAIRGDAAQGSASGAVGFQVVAQIHQREGARRGIGHLTSRIGASNSAGPSAYVRATGAPVHTQRRTAHAKTRADNSRRSRPCSQDRADTPHVSDAVSVHSELSNLGVSGRRAVPIGRVRQWRLHASDWVRRSRYAD
jgi:hypothetical protein